jgi:hypothetical protein
MSKLKQDIEGMDTAKTYQLKTKQEIFNNNYGYNRFVAQNSE